MENFLFTPLWFFGYDTTFNIISMLIALFIGIYSLKTYKLTKSNTYKYLSIAFMIIALSFFILTASNTLIYKYFLKPTIDIQKFIIVLTILKLGILGSILLSLIAYIIIIALTLKIDNIKTLFLIFLITLLAVLPATNRVFEFHLISVIILGLFGAPFFYKNLINYTKPTSVLVFLSFLLLATSHFFLLFMQHNGIYYVIGTGLQVISYLMLAVQLIMVYFK